MGYIFPYVDRVVGQSYPWTEYSPYNKNSNIHLVIRISYFAIPQEPETGMSSSKGAFAADTFDHGYLLLFKVYTGVTSDCTTGQEGTPSPFIYRGCSI